MLNAKHLIGNVLAAAVILSSCSCVHANDDCDPSRLEVVFEVDPYEGQIVTAVDLDSVQKTMEVRLKDLGSDNPNVAVRGNNQFVVSLQSERDSDTIVRVLQSTGLLEIINPNGQFLPQNLYVATSLNEVGGVASTADPSASETIYETIIVSDDIEDVFTTTNQLGASVVGFELSDDAADRFYKFTSENLGRPMSIVFDKQVISSPTINGAISEQGIIEGIPEEEIDRFITMIEFGPLAVPLQVVQSQIIDGTCDNGDEFLGSDISVGSIVIVNDDSVPLRAAPSTDALIVARLSERARLSVIAPAELAEGFVWWPVKESLPGTIGYVRSESIDLVDS